MFDFFVGWQAFFLLGILFTVTGWSSLRQYLITKQLLLGWIATFNAIFALISYTIAIGVIITHA